MAESGDDGVVSTIKRNPEAVGLAVIVSNDYEDTDTGLPPLTGTHNDGERMKDTFAAVGFATFHRTNVKYGELKDILHALSTFKNYPQSYKCISVVFTGHGGCETKMQSNGKETQLKYLHTQDKYKVEVKALVTPLLPQNAPAIGNIPKLFFIDACRGMGEMYKDSVIVPRGGDEGGMGSHKREVLQKGANEVVTVDVPSEGNYLIAYSTINEYKSYEVKNDGGIWMKLLSEKLQSSRGDSVPDVLTNVNAELMQRFQDKKWRKAMTQPEFICRLNGTVKLHHLRSRAFSSSPPLAPSKRSPPTQHLQPQSAQQLGDSRQQLNTLWQNGLITKPEFSTQGYDADWVGMVTMKLESSGKEMKFTTSKPEQTKQNAYESVANIALKKIEPIIRPKSSVPSLKKQVSSPAKASGLQQTNSSKTGVLMLKEYCEKNRLCYRFEELPTGYVQSFKAKVFVTDGDSRITAQAIGEEKPRKKEAEHSAAECVLRKLPQ